MGLSVKIAAGLSALSMTISPPAVAAARAQATPPSFISPWVALSALGPSSSSAGLCASAAAAASSASQAGAPGCVLPQVDAPVPVAQAGPAPVSPLSPVLPVATAGGLGFLPILLGLATLAAGIALLAGSGKDNAISARPISPA